MHRMLLYITYLILTIKFTSFEIFFFLHEKVKREGCIKNVVTGHLDIS
jgi:hypothetical protein